MKVEVIKYDNEIIGINLLAEIADERYIIQKFWKEGIKTDAISNSNKLHLSFADLTKKIKECTCGNCECDE